VSRGAAIAEVFHTVLDATDRFAAICRATVAGLRSWRAKLVSPLALGLPAEMVRDPPAGNQ
jgi:hypothetical protein